MQSGAAQADELAQGRRLHEAVPVAQVLHAGQVAATLARGAPTARAATRAARFPLGAVGAYPRRGAAAPHSPAGLCARQARASSSGSIGAHVFADTHAQGLGEQPQWLYTVAFDEQELWGADTPRQRSTVSVDAWEPYLEPA